MRIFTFLMALVLASTLCFAQNGSLDFGSNNAYVSFGTNSNLGLAQITLEGWFKWSGHGTTASSGSGGVIAIPLITKGRGESDGNTRDLNYFFGIQSGTNFLCADFEEGTAGNSPGLNHPIIGNTAVTPNQWFHAAATYDGSVWKLYLNGNLQGSITINEPLQHLSIQHAALGAALNSAGSAAGHFEGLMDEVRIWSYVRSESQIWDAADSVITGPKAGLVALWSLDDATGTSVFDASGNVVTGTILGSGYSWSTEVAPYNATLVQSLDFANSGSYVTFGNNTTLGLSAFTLECWFQKTGTGSTAYSGTGGVTAYPLLSKGRAESDGNTKDLNYFFGIQSGTKYLCADFEESTTGGYPGLNHPVVGHTAILDNQWYHAAATYDGGTWKLYLNGVLEDSLVVNEPVQNNSIGHASLATALNSTGSSAGRFAGLMDEVRVWDYARTEQEIRADINEEIVGAQPNLVARWGMNNANGTTVIDSSGNGVDGTIVGAGYSLSNASAPFDLDFTPPDTSKALQLEGTDSYVTFGDTSALGLAQFTLEGWVKKEGSGVTTSSGSGGVSAAPLITKGVGEVDGSNRDLNYFFGIQSGTNVLCADFEEGAGGSSPGLNHPVVGQTALQDNQWYHVAATYDGATWSLYLNGQLDGTTTINQPVQNLSIQHAGLGTALNSTGTANGRFNGSMDEVRIWNYARSQAQILATANTELYGPQTGLVARWALNDIEGNVVADSSGNGLDGQLIGFGHNWLQAGAPFNVDTNFNIVPEITIADSATAVECVVDSIVLSVDVDDLNSKDELVVQFYGRPKKKNIDPFTLIGLPDTQFYTEQSRGGSNAIFKDQTSWVVANQEALNIVHTMQLGDCVQNGQNGGNDIEWKRADTSMSIMEDPITTHHHDGMSYTMCVGNHDQSPFGSATGSTDFYNQYFGVSRFAGRYYWGGNYGSNADNNYQLFSASGMDFIVISLEYDANPNISVLAWADSLLKANSNRQGIIVAHYLINTAGNFGSQGAATYNALKDNPNLFLMLSGHIAGEGLRADTYNGNTVYTILADYQSRSNGGDGWLRLMEIDPSTKSMHVKTYSPWLNKYETDANSQFTLTDLNIPGDVTPFTLMHTDSLAGNGIASYTWKNLPLDTTYQWYVAVSDGRDTVESSIYEFSTAPGSTQNESICEGDSILLGGAYQTEAGTYLDLLPTIDGCDSVVSTILTVDSSSVCDNVSGDSLVIVTEPGWMKSTVTNTAEAGSYPWTGVSSLPTVGTYILPAEIGQPYPWHSIDSVEGAHVFKSGNGVTFFRTTFTLTVNTGVMAQIRSFMDDGMEIYVNGQMLAREDDRDADNFRGAQHHLMLMADGNQSNGDNGDQAFDVVNNYRMDSMVHVGQNELVIALRNAPQTSDKGGFSFRMDLKTGVPSVQLLSQYIVSDAEWMKSTVTTPGGSSWNWPGVNNLPAANTFTEEVELGQPYHWYSTEEVPGSFAIKATENVTYYRRRFNITDSANISARLRSTFDENLMVFINDSLIAGHYQHGLQNRAMPAHDVDYPNGGIPINGNAGGDMFMQVENVDWNQILRKGDNYITVALQNRANEPGGFSLRLDLDQSGAPVIRKVDEANEHRNRVDKEALAFNLYPNPTTGKVYVELVKSPSDDNQVLVFDLNGKLLYQRTLINPETGLMDIDLKDYADGMYIIRIRSGGEMYLGKRVMKF
ncbi:hypothetical protein Oweho_2792 [Owenweeksia hongkongensis DSM 17368]|uniref:LamG-like jellyroll fold domain-containing protein n=1 Tax=Owenweeksia hongkongensis (strain DSM 17368 / CIP 108786 / JCM 12287 / NRRL B-23963 / UST20020801) TaxID=926562 RepID=G8R086_OWEHD|nr:LamG-like jellyroll fold domain-containing protein [Owenweeksia hongkongensis]AEV33752.1 hypothetical protein Oweho_2792 [Owenweeksia hongkongensis DSM 17368]